LIKTLIGEIQKELDEATVTGDIEGYDTPFAFSTNAGKQKRKKISTNSTGYEMIGEILDNKDINQIKKLIRDVVGDILRDIWLKRQAWK
tara:strand:+ start:61 stop:327 length:267 start_codon:yes stop_codon:yes gene_type:complete